MNTFLLFADGKAQDLSMFSPASPPAESIHELSILVFAITGIIFLIVEGVLCYCLLRFRRSGPSRTEPAQVYGTRPIEIAWTAAPLLIGTILTLATARTLWDATVDPPNPTAGVQRRFFTVVRRQ